MYQGLPQKQIAIKLVSGTKKRRGYDTYPAVFIFIPFYAMVISLNQTVPPAGIIKENSVH